MYAIKRSMGKVSIGGDMTLSEDLAERVKRHPSPRWSVPLLALLFTGALFAQAPSPVPNQALTGGTAAHRDTGYPVIFEGKTLFTLLAGYGAITPEKRAEAIRARLLRMAQDPFLDEGQLRIEETDLGTLVLYRGDLIVSALDSDVRAEGKPRRQLAEEWAKVLFQAAQDYREVHSGERKTRHILWAAGVTFLLILLLFLLIRAFRWLERWEGRRYRVHLERLNLQGEVQLIRWAFSGLRWGASALLLYIYALLLFRIIPQTHGWAVALGSYTFIPLRKMGVGILSSLPDLLIIAIIVFAAKVALRAIRAFFVQAAEGHITLPGIQAYWAMPAYKTVRLALIALAVLVIYPYVPGSDSPGFKGLTLFAGALFTFGASGTIGNLLNGLILMGVNPFTVGDRVRIGETEGDVTRVTFFTTQIRTIKNVEVVVPNTQVLQSHIVNYSAQAKGAGLILHTTVTIGYDAPWRKVHENLLEAAHRTEHLLADPSPFILQTALNDFYVSYQLNAYTREANLQANIYGQLHQNIQDVFNEAGMEIMSPHFAALRDGNPIAIPEAHREKGYTPPRFRVDSKPTGPETGV